MDYNEKFILEAEKRFKKVSRLKDDIAKFPLSENVLAAAINKEKSKEFGEVFTSLWLVDQMIEQVKFKHYDYQTLDLCAGYGQFSIRLMRHLYELDSNFDVKKFIRENHSFAELQLSSCWRLLNTFGNKITLFIGDATHLNKVPEKARGLWLYIEEAERWICLTKTIQGILSPNGIKKPPCSEEVFTSSIQQLTDHYNKEYKTMQTMHELTASQMKSSPAMRLEIIKTVNSCCKEMLGEQMLQNVYTPNSKVQEMVNCVDDIENKTILVLFNCEIVEDLINRKKVDPKRITFGTEVCADAKSDLMRDMYGVDTFNFNIDPSSLSFAAKFKNKSWDVLLSNPPYNDHLHLKMLMSLMDHNVAKEYVIVHPANWLIDRKGDFPLFNSFKTRVSGSLRSVDLFNGNTVFNIGLFYPCVISHIDTNKRDQKIDVKYFDDVYTVDSIDEISKYGKSWEKIVAPFFRKIKAHIKDNGNVWTHNVKTIKSDKSHCQLAAIRGNHSKDGCLYKDDFYTVVQLQSDKDKGIRKGMDKRPGPTFEFDSSSDRNNFIDYLKTDFARFCLSYYKIGQNVYYGEMSMIPWLDFTKIWNDEKLYQHFDINKDTQDYIRKFLPDYYGIRK